MTLHRIETELEPEEVRAELLKIQRGQIQMERLRCSERKRRMSHFFIWGLGFLLRIVLVSRASGSQSEQDKGPDVLHKSLWH